MTEKVMNVDALPSLLITTFHTNKIRVRQMGGSISIEPIVEDVTEKKYSCPFLGTAMGGSLTVDRLLEMKHTEKELEYANEKRLRS